MAISDKNTRVNVTMPKEIFKILSFMADSEDRSVSNLVLMIIKKHLRENKHFTFEDYDD